MGGIFGVASKTAACWICFLELIIILIWEPDEEEWQFMTNRRALTVQYIT